MTLREFCKITDMELCIRYQEGCVYWTSRCKSKGIATIPNELLNREIAEVKATVDTWDENYLEIILKPIDK